MISKGALLVSISNRPSHVCNVVKITCSVRQYASKKKGGFFRKMVDSVESLTGKSTKNEEAELEETPDIPSSDSIFADLEEIQRDEEERKRELIESSRLKSRLFYSDRALLHNQMPQAGIQWEKNDEHRDNRFKASMLAKYGKKTGIDPSVAWPTREYIEEQREYESVLYDGKTLKEMIEHVERTEREKEEEINKIEEEIRQNLAKQEAEIKAWQKRVEGRNVYAERERSKRRQILDELRDEYGYEINPNDPQFAERIEEKEKEIAKARKQDKKTKQNEQKDKYAAKLKAEKEEKLKKV